MVLRAPVPFFFSMLLCPLFFFFSVLLIVVGEEAVLMLEECSRSESGLGFGGITHLWYFLTQ